MRSGKLNHSLKHIKSLKEVIAKISTEKVDLEKRLLTIKDLEAQIESLKKEAAGLHEWIDKRDSELIQARAETDDVRAQLKDVRVELGDSVADVTKLTHDVNGLTQVVNSSRQLRDQMKEKIQKLENRVKELEAQEEEVKKLRRRLQESTQDTRILAQKLREHGEGPQAGETNYGTKTGRFNAKDPNYSNVPKKDPAKEPIRNELDHDPTGHGY